MTSSIPPELKVVHFGRVSKKSCTESTFHSRWSVLTYGIFCYFRTCDKAKTFLEALPCSNSNDVELSKPEHRMAFKTLLHQHPPRGYIKLLDRHGQAVSSLHVDEINRQIIINHKNRHFVIKMDTSKAFHEWMSAFGSLHLDTKYAHLQHIGLDMEPPHFEAKIDENDSVVETPDTDMSTDRDALYKKYEEEEKRLQMESKKLEFLLKKDDKIIVQQFQQIRDELHV